jgi:ribose-phosphate pyrophosphokinase
MEKYRSAGVVSGETLIGEVRGRSVVIIDDLISTGGTIARAARACAEHGALAVFAAASHGLFAASDPGLTRLDELVVTDSVSPAQPPSPSLRDKLTTITVANLFAEAIRRLHAGGSIVELLRQ